MSSPLSATSAVEPELVMISAVKTDGGKDKEYVELYNPGIDSVDVSGWELEYVLQLASTASQTCKTDSWSGEENNVKQLLLPAESVIGPQERLRVFFSGMSDDKQGSVRLIQYRGAGEAAVRIVHDLVGWGSETLLSTCSEQSAAEIAKDNQVLIRCVSEGIFRDTDDNRADFSIVGDGGANSVDNPPECPSDVIEPAPTACEKAVVSEILPNPSGVDTGNEYIELHNPTADSIALQGCELSVTGATKIFAFAETDVLEPGEYKAFYDNKTELTLPNSAGGELVVASAQAEYAYTYPANMKDDEAWAIIGSNWQATDNPTPHAPNEPMSIKEEVQEEEEGVLAPCPAGKYRNPDTNRCRTLESSDDGLGPCAEGQERNPETNRCRSIVATLASLIPCRDGQERNPSTNRCRNVILASSATLVPCKAGQERNPATNRCRSVLAASTELKPCAEGQERNPETNRCRTIVAAKSGATIPDKKGTNDSKPLNYLLLGIVGVSAVGYGVYEYRQDIKNKWHTLRSRVRL